MKLDGIIVTRSSMEALNYFSDNICMAAEKMGYKTYVIDTERAETYLGKELDLFVEKYRCTAVFFNQIGLLLTDDFGKNYWDAKQIPVYSMQVDHPRNFADAMTEPIEMLRVVCID